MDTSNSQSPLELTELLELVLLHLDQGKILPLQRVSRYWFNTISESPLIQQKLFFQPLPLSKAAGRLPELNPLVEPLFPFLFARHPCLGDHMCQNGAQWTCESWLKDPVRRKAILRPEASWRRMLPVQPAAPIDGVMFADYYPEYDGKLQQNYLEFCEVYPCEHASNLSSRSNLGDNATMGLLYDIVLHIFSSPQTLSLFDCINPSHTHSGVYALRTEPHYAYENSHAGVYVQWNMFKFSHPFDSRHLGYNEPRRWSFFPTSFGDADSEIRPEYYEGVTPHNAITIHVSEVQCGATSTQRGWPGSNCSWSSSRPASVPALKELVPLPAGVVRKGNGDSRYKMGNCFRSYEIYGKIPLEVASDLEIEQSCVELDRVQWARVVFEESCDLICRYYEDHLGLSTGLL